MGKKLHPRPLAALCLRGSIVFAGPVQAHIHTLFRDLCDLFFVDYF